MEEHLTSPGAFIAASLSMLAVVVFLIVFFRRRNWL
jgi:hypothetical protein